MSFTSISKTYFNTNEMLFKKLIEIGATCSNLNFYNNNNPNPDVNYLFIDKNNHYLFI